MTPKIRTISGANVSHFSFGTMQFGSNASEHESANMYAACREAGINFFDTAYVYTKGQSETILGRLMSSERDDVFIATKCAYATAARPEEMDLQVNESRKRLGTDVIDLLYLHKWDPTTPLDLTFSHLAKLVDKGVVRHVGISNYAAWQAVKAQQTAREFGIEIQFIQPMYSLVKRQVEVEILPMAESEGILVCPYSPLGGGLLTGKYASGKTGRLSDDPRYASRYARDWMHSAAQKLSELARETGTHPATLAVSWVARHSAVYGPIISARSTDQLRPSLDALNFKMDDDLYAAISSLTPNPPPATDRLEEAL